ncbi:hypothetical protein NX722_05420 [Endozoicomonas gorgoniicola]|uniref:Uncharacterized protein n=1 Tax=Endozoicomonas gorgoniicola TaxID=1234144 RepID=A0ABT3MRU8_9GAMM|nr:hypothetical protein [Endozoicomonas gorgoniicola]MCW7552092.1 hypothetical protein [Endozoicomonas gorgoniicola]
MNYAFTLVLSLFSRMCNRLLYHTPPVLVLVLLLTPLSMALPPGKTTSQTEIVPITASSRHDKIVWPEDIVVLEEQDMVLYVTTSGPSYKESSRRLNLSARTFTRNSPITTFGNKGDVSLEQFSNVDSARGIAKDDSLYIAILGSLKDTPDKPNLYILRFWLSSGKIDTTFASNSIQTLPAEQYSYFPESLLIHNNRLLVTANLYSEGSRIYAFDLETGQLDSRFAEAGQLNLGSDKTKGFISKTVLDGNDLYIGASFRDPNNLAEEKYSNRIAVCRVNLITGQIEAPFDCTNEASWLDSQYGHNNKIRAMALTINGALVMGVDENTTAVPYIKNATVIYSFDRTTGALNRTFGTSGRREITGPEERHMLRSITPAGEHLLVNIERLSPNQTGKLESPFSADKESAVYALHTRTGEDDHSFGDNGRSSLTGETLRRLTTRYAMHQPEQNRLLVVMDESIDNREFTKTCNDMVEVLRKGLEKPSSPLNQPLLTSYHVEFEANLSLQAKLTDEHQVFDGRWPARPGSIETELYDYLVQLCPRPEITRQLNVFAIDTETGTLEQDFGNYNGETIISPGPGESLVAYKAHTATSGEMVLFNQLFQDKHNRTHFNIAILSPSGLSSHYPLIKRLSHYRSDADSHLSGYKALVLALALLAAGYDMSQLD